MIFYISDTHFNHANIIKYCSRPFGSVAHMNIVMWRRLQAVDAAGHQIIHGGDWGFRTQDFAQEYGVFMHPENHVLVMGNHDREHSRMYAPWFGTVVGKRKHWQTNVHKVQDTLPTIQDVLVSHEALADLGSTTINLFGHHHNNPMYRKHYPHLTERHWNISVELLDYHPHTLADIVQRPRVDQRTDDPQYAHLDDANKYGD